MLSPEYYENCADVILSLYAELEDAILRDIIRRIMKTGTVTESAKWQALMLQEAGLLYNDIVKEIADRTDACAEQVKALFEDAGVETVQIDNEIYRKAGLVPVDIRQSPSMRQVLEAGYRNTLGHLDNLTSTLPSAGQRLYINACNQAYMKVTSGAFSYQQAVMQAVRDTAASGIKIIRYDSGHEDRIETAVRRAVLTGVGQTCREIGKMNAEENGCDLMELSAHAGARPDHAVWQGQLVDLTGRRTGEIIDGKRVLSLSDIGYGLVIGFGGANCRHDWYPYFEGYSVPLYSQEYLEEMNARNISYNGKMYTRYEISQMQRAGERKIRALKREASAYDTAAKNAPDSRTEIEMKGAFQAVSVKLKDSEKQLSEFCKATGQDRDRFREQELGFGRSQAQRAVWAKKKEVDKYKSIRYNKDGTIIVTDDWKHKDKVSIPQKYKPNAVIETSTVSKNGNIQIDRTIYDENGRMKTQVHSGNHGKPNQHPYGNNGEHHHYYTWEENKKHPIRITDNLTDNERKEHGDIL